MSIGLDEIVHQQIITNRLFSLFLRKLYPETVTQQTLVEILADAGATDAEIAAVLGTSTGTVAISRHRAKEKTTEGDS